MNSPEPSSQNRIWLTKALELAGVYDLPLPSSDLPEDEQISSVIAGLRNIWDHIAAEELFARGRLCPWLEGPDFGDISTPATMRAHIEEWRTAKGITLWLASRAEELLWTQE